MNASDTSRIPADRMRGLIHDGTAKPLLAGFFPAPIKVAGAWWHIPSASPPESDYVPAATEQANQYDRLARRLELAHTPRPNGRRP